jgi:hypothetical protein
MHFAPHFFLLLKKAANIRGRDTGDSAHWYAITVKSVDLFVYVAVNDPGNRSHICTDHNKIRYPASSRTFAIFPTSFRRSSTGVSQISGSAERTGW